MPFRRMHVASAASIILLLVGASPAAAIVNGTPDQAHPYVGALFLTDSHGDTYFLCTGSLLGPEWF